jgi:hypothetical protein
MTEDPLLAQATTAVEGLFAFLGVDAPDEEVAFVVQLFYHLLRLLSLLQGLFGGGTPATAPGP